MFECTTWHASFTDFFIKLRRYTAIWKQLLFANYRNRVRGAVLGLSQDGACTDLFENLCVNRLKGDLSNILSVHPHIHKEIIKRSPLCNSSHSSPSLPHCRARICERLWSPGIDSEESIPRNRFRQRM